MLNTNPAPPSTGGPSRDIVVDGIPLRLFTAEQVIVMDAPPPRHDELAPRLTVSGGGQCISAAVLAAKAKSFDDGLYAAVEVFLQSHAKRGLLAAMRNAHPLVAAAAELGGGPAISAGDRAAQLIRDEFLGNERRSKPIGFYTWSPQLSEIFRQDRLLQSPFSSSNGADVLALVHALHRQPEHRKAYEQTLRFAERLTNPLGMADLRTWLRSLDGGFAYEPPTDLAWLPPSVSHETQLLRRLTADGTAPDDHDLIRELIARVRAGTLDLEPGPASGWYDHQTWALEPLIAPDRSEERDRLKCRSDYRSHLEALFRGILTLTRETHIKQVEIMPRLSVAPPALEIRPELTVEPLATHYARRAAAYGFVRRFLADEFGRGALAGTCRLTADGRVCGPLDEELLDMERIFDGAASRARFDLGMASTADDGAFAAFAANSASDPDVGQDLRAMVPVGIDPDTGRTKVWCFLGWNDLPATAEFHVAPKVTPLTNTPVHIRFENWFGRLATPVMVEVSTTRLLDRHEFRLLCDRERTKTRILRAIAAG